MILDTSKAVWTSTQNRPLTVVIGAGFAGLNFVKHASKLNSDVLLIDKNNYHQFQPLLYQVAISGLEPDAIASPIRKIIDQCQNVHFLMAELQAVDPKNNHIELNIGTIKYDTLIFASGSKTNFYGNTQLEQHAFGLKTIEDALSLRSWIVHTFEMASTYPEDGSWLRYGLAGAGAAGVEMAGALAEYTRKLVHKDYPNINPKNVEIFLFEGGDTPLAAMSKRAQQRVTRIIRELGIHFISNAYVTHFDRKDIQYKLKNEVKEIKGRTLIWTAGVQAEIFKGIQSDTIGPSNRMKVNEHLQVRGFSNIYAIGDAAYLSSPNYPNGLPMVAQVAIQQGTYLANHFNRSSKEPFIYKDKGAMAIVGMTQAVADVKSLFISGPIGWLLWSFVHLISLISFRNRISVATNWMLKYFNYENAHQLITRSIEPKK